MTMNIRAFSILAGLMVWAAPAASQTPISCGMSITSPGQYVLTENLTCAVFPAVQVAAANVHINFQGHTLSAVKPPLNCGGPPFQIGCAPAIVTALEGGCVSAPGLHINGGTITGFGVAIVLCGPEGASGTNAKVNGMNLIDNEFIGLALVNYNDSHISGSNLSRNRVDSGVRLINSHQNRFTSNNVSQNYLAGYSLTDSNNNIITSNMVLENGYFGLVLANSDYNTIRGSIVTGNPLFNAGLGPGIALQTGSDNNLIQSNTTTQNSYGVVLFSGATTNTVHANAASNNATFDLADFNADCDANLWKNNSFATRNQTCVR